MFAGVFIMIVRFLWLSLAANFALASGLHPRWIQWETAFRFQNPSPNTYAVGVSIPETYLAD